MNEKMNGDPFDECSRWINREKRVALSKFDRVRFGTRVTAALEGGVRLRPASHHLLARAAVALVAVLVVIAGVWTLALRWNPPPLIRATTVEAALRKSAGGWASETIQTPPSIPGSHEVQTRAWQIQRLIYRSHRSSDPADLGMLVMAALASAGGRSAPTAEPELLRDVDRDALGRRIAALRAM